VAVVSGEQSLSYAELNAAANRLAHYLRDLGVGPDARVAICVERSFEMVIGLLAVLKAGGAYVPLDPAYPVERLAYMLADSAPLALLTQGSLADGFRDSAPGLPVIDLAADAEQWAGQSTQPDPAALGLSPPPAYVIYTSGSTGKPKGAMNEHLGIVNRLLWKQSARSQTQRRGAGEDPFSFDVSVWEFFGP
jgi:arthrofactin-type cyclic lipopeptide synthetase B